MGSVNAATHDVWRLFVAVDLPDDVKLRLQHVRQRLESAGWQARWTRPDTMHLTLRFFGNQPVASIDLLKDCLRSALHGVAAFRLGTGSMGAFPDVRRPRVVWLGVDDRSGTLARTASDIEQASRELGIEPEERPFSPHLTVARVRPEDRMSISSVEQHFEALDRLPRLQIEVDHATLYRSELRRGGSIYTVVERFQFEAQP